MYNGDETDDEESAHFICVVLFIHMYKLFVMLGKSNKMSVLWKEITFSWKHQDHLFSILLYCYVCCFLLWKLACIHFQDEVKYIVSLFVCVFRTRQHGLSYRARAIICKCCAIQLMLNGSQNERIFAWHRAACMLRTTHFPHEKYQKEKKFRLPINSFSIELCDWSSLGKNNKNSD